MQKIPFLDLSKVHNDFKEEINSSINNVVKSGDFILGSEIILTRLDNFQNSNSYFSKNN